MYTFVSSLRGGAVMRLRGFPREKLAAGAAPSEMAKQISLFAIWQKKACPAIRDVLCSVCTVMIFSCSKCAMEIFHMQATCILFFKLFCRDLKDKLIRNMYTAAGVITCMYDMIVWA